MCGIFGIIAKKGDVAKKLLVIGKRLAYRGYDSAGLATFHNGQIDLRKDVGTVEHVIESLKLEEMKGTIGIGQLRWSTFGRPSQLNAQPHFDCDKDMVGAHNGNIVSYHETKENLEKEGHEIRSMNDGEICVHAVEKYYDKEKDMIKAIIGGISEMDGAFAFVTYHKDNPEKLYAVKMGSSLVIGLGEEETYVASDLPSILPLTKNFVPLNDGEIVELTANSYRIFSAVDGSEIKRESRIAELSAEDAVKGEFDYFLTKEIHEQIDATEKLAYGLESDTLDEIVEQLTKVDKVFLVGCGSSFNACNVGSYYFNNVAGVLAIPVIGGRFFEEYKDYDPGENTAILCVSQSGETKDVINTINFAKPKGFHILGMINVPGSTVERMSEAFAYIGAGIERSVPATKTYTNQVLLFLILAARIGYAKGKLSNQEYEALKEEIHNLSKLVKKTILDTNERAMKLAKVLGKIDAMSLLGYGVTFGVALEGALKIREINYISAEAMYSSEFKHGPLSIVSDGYPVIYVVAPDDKYYVISHISEVECRDGRPIVVGEQIDGLDKYVKEGDYFEIPKSSQLISPILAAIPLQLLALYMSIERGIDPDYPRNLSKTLTVD
ncbi:MAG TPA: glutamine--fructose-6-phosphate transaminase (isomerizing) [candidate division Zixibacteria bacterium]|nr:glutamine--fructose-6-phosphate transaminase (isomerizing) [candidate division Zixibacteria bacterium]